MSNIHYLRETLEQSHHSQAKVAASLWSVPSSEQAATAKKLVQAGLRLWHWDFSDGSIGEIGGFTPQQAHDMNRETQLLSEAHLMTSDPLAIVGEWITVCNRIIIHAESSHIEECIEVIKSHGKTPIIALNPDSPVTLLDNLPRDLGVLVMSVPPGRAGSTFQEATYWRLETLRDRPMLGVDGSVSLARAKKCFTHGATWVVSGTDLCNSAMKHAWLSEVATG